VFVKHNDAIAKHFKLIPAVDIPEHWKIVTEKRALENLKYTFGIND
jgi:hypothetical protein